MEAEGSSRDLLQRFAGSTTISNRPPPPPVAVAESGGDDVELSLGLSLGGSFSSSAREKKTNMLIRSSSISSFPFFDTKDEIFQSGPTQLQRTCSLPVPGAAEEYRKRKEMQSLKRMEAKRKRSEKRNSWLNSKDEDGISGCPCTARVSAPGLPPLGSTSSSGGTMQGFEIVRFSKFSTTKSSSTSNQTSLKTSTTNEENALKRIERGRSTAMEMEGSVVEEMPCVSTRGSGPDGKRIEGFLYKYRKGEEVRIVCVCHGSFLTPAEFVRHAGGGDVDHPLRHIVVKSASSSTFL